ncbi:MAG: DEAD/DEAH box helicase [Candidatus Actinomarina sp.]
MDYQKELNLPFPLRDYQKTGVDFLIGNSSALLGDDMGLGKTVQTIVALKKLFKPKGFKRTLLIVPNSLVSNWVKEFTIWYPELPVGVLIGNKESRENTLKHSSSIIISTYEQIRIIYEQPKDFGQFEYLIFDEAQRLKNSSSNIHQACKKIESKNTWMLSGTPLENNAEDIVSLFSILKYGALQRGYTPSEIKEIISPYLLRRLKADILQELPDLLEEDKYLDLNEKQLVFYNSLIEQKLKLDKKDSSGMLALITELKKVCNFDPISETSSKLDYLKEIIQDSFTKGEKIIVFSQYVETLKFIQKNLSIKTLKFDGSLNKKQKDSIVDEFQNSTEPIVFLASLQAGGVGLNLQAASRVVIFDRWWNPAVEKQAIARAHRMGNKNKVHAIKFVSAGTIEERILDLLHYKEDLFDEIVEGAVELKDRASLAELLEIKE